MTLIFNLLTQRCTVDALTLRQDFCQFVLKSEYFALNAFLNALYVYKAQCYN